jgi:hypothetical protein
VVTVVSSGTDEVAGEVETTGLVTGLDLIGVVVTPWLEDEAGVEAGVDWAGEDFGVVEATDDTEVVAWDVGLVYEAMVVEEW